MTIDGKNSYAAITKNIILMVRIDNDGIKRQN